MSKAPLAPSNNSPGQENAHARDSFASSNSPPIQHPQACAQVPTNPRFSRGASVAAPAAYGYTNPQHDRTLSRDTYAPGMYGSLSSDGSASVLTPMSSIDFEKSKVGSEKASRKTRRDPEKAMSPTGNDSHRLANMADAVSLAYWEDEPDHGRQLQEQKAVRILVYLSGPCVVLSALNTAWACISLVITLLSQPVRICAKRPTFGQQLAGLLGPALNLQLRCIYTPLPPHVDEDASYRALMLVAVHMLSPFLSMSMMFVAWVVAAYWICSAMLGDPAGMDKRDDGRETVLGLRAWWETWLMRSMVEQ